VTDGTSVPTAAPPVTLRGQELRGTKDYFGGTHRSVSPEETLDRIRPHLRAAGVTRLADVTGLDRVGIATALAYRPNSRTLSNASGKGFTRAAAMASAAMEALEVCHAEEPRLLRVRSSYVDLQDQGPVIPRDQLRLSRGSLFSVNHVETWVEGWDLVTQRPMWVPYLQTALALDPDGPSPHWRPFETGSNGLASGNVPVEAICVGLLEVIERDAIACLSAARPKRSFAGRRVLANTIRFPMAVDLLERLGKAALDVVVYDQRCDTDVPVYMASLYDRMNPGIGSYSGFGAHLDPEIALVRALTEAVQSRLTYIAGSRDDYFRHDYLAHRTRDGALDVQAMEREPATVDASRTLSSATPTFEGDVALLLEKLRRTGIDHVIVLDLTHEEVGIPVVRVIVPGLEGCSLLSNYAPGHRALTYARQGLGQ
jgi:ribosomal protein S12 methylthiotransferase accessory factor